MPFNHQTLHFDASSTFLNWSVELENCTLTAAGLSLSRGLDALPSFIGRLGITPPGDENLQIYLPLISATLGGTDGASWSGSIRIRSHLFLVLNYMAASSGFVYITWVTF